MDWLNYHHLFYFWMVAREGSVTAACERLQLAQPTVSAQLQKLQRALKTTLFVRRGRQLELSEAGRLVFQYADEIFSLGRELQSVLAGRPSHRPLRFAVGITEVLPKLMAFRVLEPVLALPEPIELVCDEDRLESLLNNLAAHRLDLVLSDSPVSPSANARAFNHLLGECAVTAFGTKELASRFRKRFPASLADAPFVLPTPNTVLRRSLDQWFDRHGIQPRIAAQCHDSALLKTMGQAGLGLFFGPSAIENEIAAQYRVSAIGRLEGVVERLYAISPERRIKHPAVVAISETARKTLF